LLLAKTLYGAFIPPKVVFVHVKLTLVLLAVAGNLALLGMRKRTALLAPDGGPAYGRTLRVVAVVQTLTTLMRPLAVIVVISCRQQPVAVAGATGAAEAAGRSASAAKGAAVVAVAAAKRKEPTRRPQPRIRPRTRSVTAMGSWGRLSF